MKINEIEKLVEIIKNSDLNELIIEQEGTRIHLKREKQIIVSTAETVNPQVKFAENVVDSGAKEAPTENLDENLLAIESPMVGTFYRTPSPGAEPFVKEGDIVHENTVCCIIEAMKIFNQIEAKVKGKVIKVLVENEEAIEYGQKLFLVEPL